MTTSYAVWTLSGGPSTFNGLALDTLFIFVDTISSATAITWKLTRDLAGDEAITPEYSTDLVIGQTTATDGSCISGLGMLLPNMSEASLSTIYLWCKVDAGSCVGASARISYEANSY